MHACIGKFKKLRRVSIVHSIVADKKGSRGNHPCKRRDNQIYMFRPGQGEMCTLSFFTIRNWKNSVKGLVGKLENIPWEWLNDTKYTYMHQPHTYLNTFVKRCLMCKQSRGHCPWHATNLKQALNHHNWPAHCFVDVLVFLHVGFKTVFGTKKPSK